MDNSFAIKQRPGVQKTYSMRDPVPIREVAKAELDLSKSVGSSTDDTRRRDRHDEKNRDQDHDSNQNPHGDHPPHEVISDAESRDVINRENDIRAQTGAREHPDQALLRQRAYRPTGNDTETPSPIEPHANIKA